jgi:hypothetical protein
MDDRLTELRERYGRQYLPRLFANSTDDTPSEIRERYIGFGIAVGGGSGLAIGAGVGVAIFGNVALGIGFGLCVGTCLGIAIGSSLGNTRLKNQTEATLQGSDGRARMFRR